MDVQGRSYGCPTGPLGRPASDVQSDTNIFVHWTSAGYVRTGHPYTSDQDVCYRCRTQILLSSLFPTSILTRRYEELPPTKLLTLNTMVGSPSTCNQYLSFRPLFVAHGCLPLSTTFLPIFTPESFE